MGKKKEKVENNWLASVVSSLKVHQEVLEVPVQNKQEGLQKTVHGYRKARSVRRHTPERRIALRRSYDQQLRVGLKGLLNQLKKQQRYKAKKAKEKEINAGLPESDKTKYEVRLTFAEWQRLWEAAGDVYFQGSWVKAHLAKVIKKKLPDGTYTEGVRMFRIDESRGWSLDNMKLVYNGRTIADGRRLDTAKR